MQQQLQASTLPIKTPRQRRKPQQISQPCQKKIPTVKS